MKLDSLDHLVLTVRNLERTIQFYTNALGMEVVNFGTGRKALSFGHQKINFTNTDGSLNPRLISQCLVQPSYVS